jgi:hypothetical protein
LIADNQIEPEEAVRAYHGVLEKLKIMPQRSLENDLVLQTNVMSYGGSSTVSLPAGIPSAKPAAKSAASRPAASVTSSSTPAEPNFAKMTQAEKLAYNKARRDRIFG